jgi:hypothetical protein
MIIQKLKPSLSSPFDSAEKYYAILSAINNIPLTQRELQLLAFTAVKGNMSYGNVKEEFCRKYGTTFPTISNIIYKLKRIGMLIKENGKIKVSPIIALNFNEEIRMEIKLLANGS